MCYSEGGGGWLARHRTIEKMSAPHRLDIFEHGHRAVCSDVLISSFLDILEDEAGLEVQSSSQCRNVDKPATEGPQKATRSAGYWLAT